MVRNRDAGNRQVHGNKHKMDMYKRLWENELRYEENKNWFGRSEI